MPAENSRSGNSRGRRNMPAMSSASWPSRPMPSRRCTIECAAVCPVQTTPASGSNLTGSRGASKPSFTCLSISRWRGFASTCCASRSASASHTAPVSSSSTMPARSQATRSAGCFFTSARPCTIRLRCALSPLKVHAPLARTRTGTGLPASVLISSAASGLGMAREYTPRAMQLIDIGANLTHPAVHADLPAVLARARRAGVATIIVTGASVAESTGALQTAGANPETIYPTAGVHPHHARECDASTIPALRVLAQQPRVVAIGECGLDFNRNYSPHPDQEKWFAAQVELACELEKPLFLHSRDAEEKFIEVLRQFKNLPAAVAHCFTGTREELHACLDLGLYIGITGWICDERRGAHLLQLVRDVPADRLMLETDSPYLTPRDMRPQPRARRNEPAHLLHILRAAARALGKPPDHLAQETTRNAKDFFGLP